MNREEHFLSFREHPWFGKFFKRLTSEELKYCLYILEEYAETKPEEFEMRVSKLFLDQHDKPQNSKIMIELLICANSKYLNEKFL